MHEREREEDYSPFVPGARFHRKLHVILEAHRNRFRRPKDARKEASGPPRASHLRTVRGKQKIYLRNGRHVATSVAWPKTYAATTINNKLSRIYHQLFL
ncbi:hypothetical protein PUN28_006817 [Cardiocondyla obscurior]|uniref:Uncharacterized protein n=1 Tax=Cardiocondyla obscurior TaxID=286306 RepID=A0AAW2G1J6_9HYME